MAQEIKIGDRVQLYDDETGKPYKKGIVTMYNADRGRVGVKTDTGSYAAWNVQHLVKLNQD